MRPRTIRVRLGRLRRRFSNKSNVIQTRAGAFSLPQPSLHRHWIVGRGVCLYRYAAFAHVPRSKRRAALELKVPVWSPFRKTGFHAVWAESAVMVWFWDAEAMRNRTSGDGEDPDDADRVRVLPETVFYPRKSDGVHLQACREGFELQHWRADVLLDAFWFAERPGENQIDWFLARRGLETSAPDLKVPQTPASAFDPEPWAARVRPGEWLEAHESALVAGCLLALVTAALWQEIRFRKTRHLTSGTTAAFARIQDEIDPLLQARNELVRLRRKNLALSALLAAPSQAHLMGEVDRALPSASASFHEWRYQRGELAIVIEDTEPDPISYVRALEAHPLFSQVRAEQARKAGRLKISMQVGP